MKRLQLFICMLFLSLVSLGQDYLLLDLSENPDTVHLESEEAYALVRYRTTIEFDLELAKSQINNILVQRMGCTWLTVVEFIPDNSTALTGEILLHVEENLTNSSRIGELISLLTRKAYYILQHKKGGMSNLYQVSGGEMTYPGKRNKVMLSGSDATCVYQLYRGNNLVKSMQGTGYPLMFIVDNPGSYTIKSSGNQMTIDMTGKAIFEYYPILSGKISLGQYSGGEFRIPKYRYEI